MNDITVYHGSTQIVEIPEYGYGNSKNDYGLGFYCTKNIELAKEWACPDESSNGYLNRYTIDLTQLRVLDLSHLDYSVLHWLAILLDNRSFTIKSIIGKQAQEFLLSNYLLDINNFDVIVGHRADDSYFAYANEFLNNIISLHQLEKAMYLGDLGQQIVIKSTQAYQQLRFIKVDSVNSNSYYIKRKIRDQQTRLQYLQFDRKLNDSDIYILDILRKTREKNNESLQ